MIADETGRRTIEENVAPSAFDDAGEISLRFLASLRAAMSVRDGEALNALVGRLHEAELGKLLERLEPSERAELVDVMGADFDFSALTHVDEAVRLEIIDSISNAQVADALRALDSDDAVYILEDLDESDRADILDHLPFRERLRLRRSLECGEDTAGRRMQTEYVAVPPFWTVGQTIDYLREDADLPDRFSEIFVVDPTFRLLGSVALHDMLRAANGAAIKSIMEATPQSIPATMDQEEAARIFERYDLLSAAVVDERGHLVGVLTIDDIVDVMQSEANEDLLRLGGVGDEEISDTVMTAIRSRFAWLLINLATAVLASSVIDIFDATIQQVVALAVLMPIVASMGGNAGTQTMTVAVRALAIRDINIHNAWRIVRREVVVGLLNGLLFAILIGATAIYWFDSLALGQVIAAAMVINMIAAALAGILIPLVLERVGADPALASGTFVTTVTDVVGFLSFLGLATLVFA